MTRPTSPFIGAASLEKLAASSSHLVILDARFDTSAALPSELRVVDRIPGAVHVDAASEAAGASGPRTGRLPLPDIHDLQRDARRWGVNKDSTVVVYDDGKGTLAARVWWVLRWAGVADVKILDGGVAAWRAAGLPLTTEAGLPKRGDVELSAGHLPVIDAAQSLALASQKRLIDGRSREAYDGDADLKGTGHIPGAFSLPASTLQDRHHLVKSPDALRASLAALGVDTGAGQAVIGAYCGSGVAAAYDVAALHSAGVEVALYPGSWSEWIKDPQRPVEKTASVA